MTTLSRLEDADGLSDEKVLDAVFPGTKRKRSRKAKQSAASHDPIATTSASVFRGSMFVEPSRHSGEPVFSPSGAYGSLAGTLRYIAASTPCVADTNQFRCPRCVATRSLFETGDVAEALFDGLRILAGIGAGRG